MPQRSPNLLQAAIPAVKQRLRSSGWIKVQTSSPRCDLHLKPGSSPISQGHVQMETTHKALGKQRKKAKYKLKNNLDTPHSTYCRQQQR